MKYRYILILLYIIKMLFDIPPALPTFLPAPFDENSEICGFSSSPPDGGVKFERGVFLQGLSRTIYIPDP